MMVNGTAHGTLPPKLLSPPSYEALGCTAFIMARRNPLRNDSGVLDEAG